MINNEKISVIIPVYNTEKYLRQCLYSVINQTYRNLEIIVVDDKSTDGSGVICDEFADTDCRITVIHKETNEGLSAARNTGVHYSSGDLICFVDSDDWIEHDMISYLYNLLHKYCADISMCSASYVNDAGFEIHTGELPELSVKQEFLINSTEDILKHYLFDYGDPRRINVAVWNKLYRRKCLEEIDFPVGRLYEDVFWLYKVLNKATVLAFSQCHKYNYRQNDSSICHRLFTESYFDILDANVERYNFILDQHYSLIRYVSKRFVADCKQMTQLTLRHRKIVSYSRYLIRMLYYRIIIDFNLLVYFIFKGFSTDKYVKL